MAAALNVSNQHMLGLLKKFRTQRRFKNGNEGGDVLLAQILPFIDSDEAFVSV